MYYQFLGLEAFESRQIVRRTPELEDPESAPTPPNSETDEVNPLTPPNSETHGDRKSDPDEENDFGQIVNIVHPELKDKDNDDHRMDTALNNQTDDFKYEPSNIERLKLRAKKVLGQFGGVTVIQTNEKQDTEAAEKGCDHEEDSDKHFNSGAFRTVYTTFRDEVEDELIQEGIRQATEDDDEDEEEVCIEDEDQLNMDLNRYNFDAFTEATGLEMDNNRVKEAGILGEPDNANVSKEESYEDDFEKEESFEEIKGPELEADNDEEDDLESLRSTEVLIVIDKSINLSPQQTSGGC
mgnify:FL=1